jgi:protein-L-isoaspartate O-methyltransferase
MNSDFARHQMVEQQVRAWEVLDPAVLDVLKEVPRERRSHSPTRRFPSAMARS